MKAKAKIAHKTVTSLDRASVLYDERAAQQKSYAFRWPAHFDEWRAKREKAENPVFEKEGDK